MKCPTNIVGIDTETHLIENRYEVPDGVVAGLCSGDEIQLVMWNHWDTYFPEFLKLNPTVKLAFFNGPFDMKVIGEDIFIPELKKDGRVMEIRANYRQTRIATHGWFPGSTTLASITKEITGVDLDKTSGVRVSYRRENPITEDQEHYLCDDAVATFLCGCAFDGIPTESLQARASWVLSEISRNGMFVDVPYVREQTAKISQEMEALAAKLKTFGFSVKEATADMTQMQRVARCFSLMGFPEAGDIMKQHGIKTISRNIMIVICASLYSSLSEHGKMPSDVRQQLKQCLKLVLNPPKNNAETKKLYDYFKDALTAQLRAIDCTECIEGCGDAKATGNKALLVFFETLAEQFHNGALLKGMTAFNTAFQELHEENFGWLPTAPKKLSPTAFLQKHLRTLMDEHEGLKFPYTQASEKAIKKYMRELKKKAGNSDEPIIADVSNLEKFQLKAFDMWLLSDLGVEDAFLNTYFDYKHKEKLLSTYITEKYVDTDGRAHPRLEVLLRTGRTSCSSPLMFAV